MKEVAGRVFETADLNVNFQSLKHFGLVIYHMTDKETHSASFVIRRTRYLYSLSVLVICTRYLYSLSVLIICTRYLFSLSVLVICTRYQS